MGTFIDDDFAATTKFGCVIEDSLKKLANVLIEFVGINNNFCFIYILHKDGKDGMKAIGSIFIDLKALNDSPYKPIVSA